MSNFNNMLSFYYKKKPRGRSADRKAIERQDELFYSEIQKPNTLIAPIKYIAFLPKINLLVIGETHTCPSSPGYSLLNKNFVNFLVRNEYKIFFEGDDFDETKKYEANALENHSLSIFIKKNIGYENLKLLWDDDYDITNKYTILDPRIAYTTRCIETVSTAITNRLIPWTDFKDRKNYTTCLLYWCNSELNSNFNKLKIIPSAMLKKFIKGIGLKYSSKTIYGEYSEISHYLKNSDNISGANPLFDIVLAKWAIECQNRGDTHNKFICVGAAHLGRLILILDDIDNKVIKGSDKSILKNLTAFVNEQINANMTSEEFRKKFLFLDQTANSSCESAFGSFDDDEEDTDSDDEESSKTILFKLARLKDHEFMWFERNMLFATQPFEPSVDLINILQSDKFKNVAFFADAELPGASKETMLLKRFFKKSYARIIKYNPGAPTYEELSIKSSDKTTYCQCFQIVLKLFLWMHNNSNIFPKHSDIYKVVYDAQGLDYFKLLSCIILKHKNTDDLYIYTFLNSIIEAYETDFQLLDFYYDKLVQILSSLPFDLFDNLSVFVDLNLPVVIISNNEILQYLLSYNKYINFLKKKRYVNY